MREWLSGYLFIDGDFYGEPMDRLLLDVVRPFTEQALAAGHIDQFFFVRYGENGPHLRLRLRGDPAALRREVEPSLRAHLQASAPDVRLECIPYVPETERYGGPQAMLIAESQFQASSQAAFAALGTLSRAGGRGPRLSRALVGMVLQAYVFTQSRVAAARFLRLYQRSYLHTLTGAIPEGEAMWSDAFRKSYQRQAEHLTECVDSLYELLAADRSVSPAWDAYRLSLETIKESLNRLVLANEVRVAQAPVTSWTHCVQRIVPSYVHMMNNRLGVPIREEVYLAALACQASAVSSATAGEH